MKRLVVPDSTDTGDEGDNDMSSPAFTTDKMDLRVTKVFVSYILQTTESLFLGGSGSFSNPG